jgi:two-component system C4-dicarboxylate transport sensor histidine kinase DctB
MQRTAACICAAPQGEIVEITLRDHGPGVPEALQARIFDPFFSTKEVGKGLGLGLSITYNIVRDFGGRLSVANHPDGGAVFTLTLRTANLEAVEAAE